MVRGRLDEVGLFTIFVAQLDHLAIACECNPLRAPACAHWRRGPTASAKTSLWNGLTGNGDSVFCAVNGVQQPSRGRVAMIDGGLADVDACIHGEQQTVPWPGIITVDNAMKSSCNFSPRCGLEMV